MKFETWTNPSRDGLKSTYSTVPYANDVFCVVDSSEKRRKVKVRIHAGDKQPPLTFYASSHSEGVSRLEYHLEKWGHTIIRKD